MPLPFRVMSRKCDQCLMTKDRIVPGERAAEILTECRAEDINFLCHLGTTAGQEIACRGHYDTGVGRLGRMASHFNGVVEIDPDTLQPVGEPGKLVPSGHK